MENFNIINADVTIHKKSIKKVKTEQEQESKRKDVIYRMSSNPEAKKCIFYGNLEKKLFVQLITNFFDKSYSAYLFDLLKKITYNSDEASMVIIRGKRFKIPRKQVAYGVPGTVYKFSGISVNARNWDDETDTIDAKAGREIKIVSKYMAKVASASFNYALVNNYLDNTNGIGYHSDDERELGEYPLIGGVSLGSERIMHFRSKLTGEILKIPLPHNSVIVMRYPTNKYWEHAINKSPKKIGQRISMTFRGIRKDL